WETGKAEAAHPEGAERARSRGAPWLRVPRERAGRTGTQWRSRRRDGGSSVARRGGGLTDEVGESWGRFEVVPQDAADLVQLGSRQPAQVRGRLVDLGIEVAGQVELAGSETR